jgi:hypothetical protein
MMKIQGGYEGKGVDQVLAGIIMDPVVCARVSAVWIREGLFGDEDYNLIARWAVRYMQKYNEPPGIKVNNLFSDWAASKGIDPSRARLIDKKLTDLSRLLREPINPTFVLDTAAKVFNKEIVKKQCLEVETDLDEGQVEQAISRMQSTVGIQLQDTNLLRPESDYQIWRTALDPEVQEVIIKYPSVMEKFLGTVMTRDAFVAWEAPDKSFKSYWLLDAAFRAVKGRRRVAYFEAGDLSQNQILKRMGVRAARRPLYPKSWRVPRYVSSQGVVEWDPRQSEGFLRAGEAYRAFQGLVGERDLFRLSCYNNSSLTVAMIESLLTDWARTGWMVDCVVLDYADILAPPQGVREKIDQIDQIWRQLRRISQRFNCLVLTATQTKATAYTTKSPVLRKEHFSGSKTKLAHVTGMLGINIKEGWRQNCVSGLNWIEKREGTYSETQMCICAGCLDIANPIMKCVMGSPSQPSGIDLGRVS